MDDSEPTMKSAKRMYEDMMNAPTKPSLGHSTKEMKMAEKMFSTPKKKMASGGYVQAADGCAQRGKTKGRMV
jgi:hypothetical protein